MDGQRSHYKRHLRTGPGGMNCTCCGPAPGKDRKAAKRTAKRRERQAVKRETEQSTDAE